MNGTKNGTTIVYVLTHRVKRRFRRDQVFLLGVFSKQKYASAAIRVGPPFRPGHYDGYEIFPMRIDQGGSEELG